MSNLSVVFKDPVYTHTHTHEEATTVAAGNRVPGIPIQGSNDPDVHCPGNWLEVTQEMYLQYTAAM
jgi:hypothetical protein